MKNIFILNLVLFCLLFVNLRAQTIVYETIKVSEAKVLINDNEKNSDFVIIDLRTLSEYTSGHIKNAINIDFYSSTFSDDLDELDKNKIYLIYCHSKNRSIQTFAMMQDKKITTVNLDGGITAWKAEGLSVVNEQTTRIQKSIEKISMLVFPNPCIDNIFVKIGNTRATQFKLEILDTQGNVVMREQFIAGNNINKQVNLSILRSGVYFLKISDGNNASSIRIMKL